MTDIASRESAQSSSAMAGLEWLARRSEALVIPLAALGAGILLFSLFLMLLGKSPLQFFDLM